MVRRLDAVGVKCPTCNRNSVVMEGYEHSREDGEALALDLRCMNVTCPAPEFRYVFRVYPTRTVMGVEILSHED